MNIRNRLERLEQRQPTGIPRMYFAEDETHLREIEAQHPGNNALILHWQWDSPEAAGEGINHSMANEQNSHPMKGHEMKKISICLLALSILILTLMATANANYVFCGSRIQTVETGLPECASQTFTGGHIVFKIGSTTVLDEDLVQTNGAWPSVTLSSGDDFNAVLATLTNGTSDNVEVTVTADLSGGGTRTLGGAVPESAFFFQGHQIEQGHPAHTDFAGVMTPTAVVFRVVGATVLGGRNFVVQYTCEVQ